MSKKETKRKIEHNSKVSKIKCLRCGFLTTMLRNDALYCSTLCRVQESNDRKENGKNVKVFSGNKKALQDFLNTKNNTGVFLLLENESEIIIDELNKREINDSFKLVYPSFSLYYNPLNKKKPFSMFITESLNKYIKLSKPIQLEFKIMKRD
jgi:hypothetical protein